MLAVQVRSRSEAEEELGSVGVWSSIGHGEDASASVTVGEIFILEFATIDGLATSAVASGEVTALSHEAWDDTVELGSLEVEIFALCAHAFLASAECSEVLSCLWGVLDIKGNGDSAGSLATDGDIEEDVCHLEV